MPELSVLDRFLVPRGDQIRTGDCLEQHQMRGACVPTGNQAAGRMHESADGCGGLEGAGRRRADRDHPAARRVRRVHQPSSG